MPDRPVLYCVVTELPLWVSGSAHLLYTYTTLPCTYISLLFSLVTTILCSYCDTTVLLLCYYLNTTVLLLCYYCVTAVLLPLLLPCKP